MRLLLFLLSCLCATSLIVGCGGESTQEKMMRIARERSVRSRDLAEEEKQEKTDAKMAAAKAAEKKTPSPLSEPKLPAKEEAPAIDKIKDSPALASNDVPNATPGTNQDQPASNDTSETANSPALDQLMSFSRLGSAVAHTGASQSIGVFDVQTKQLVRQIFNPDITPSSLAFNEDNSRLIVGGLGGTFKVFPLDQKNGLDRFQQGRQQRRDAAAPRKGHEGPITATAINQNGNIVATAGEKGIIRLWSNSLDEPLRLKSDSSSFVALKSYQDDKLILAATPDKRILFWSLGKKQFEARPLPGESLSAAPTCLISGLQNKGIFVGDAKGQVSMWLAGSNGMKQSQFQAHREPILGLGLIDNGKTLLTATKGGELFRWSLPIAPQVKINTIETTPFLAVSRQEAVVGVLSRSRNLDLYSLNNGNPIRRHTLSGSADTLTAAAFAPDGEILALGGSNGQISFQNKQKKVIAVARLGSAPITQIEVAPGLQTRRTPGSVQQLAMASDDGTVGVATFPELDTSRTPSVNEQLAASNTSVTGKAVVAWTMNLGIKPNGLAWSGDGNRVAVVADSGQVVELDASTGAEARRMTVGTSPLQQIVALPGDLGYAVLSKDSSIYIVSADQPPMPLTSNSTLGIRSINVSSDPKWLYSINDLGEVSAHDLNTPGAPPQSVPCGIDAGLIQYVGGTRFVVASERAPAIAVVDAATRCDHVDRSLVSMTDIGFLPDGSFAVVANGTERLKMVPLRTGNPQFLEADSVSIDQVAVHPAGVRVAGIGKANQGGSHSLVIWETVNQEVQASINLSAAPTDVIYSHDGGLLAISFADGRCEIYDGESTELVESMPVVEGLSAIAFAADNSRVLLGDSSGTVSVEPISVLGKIQTSDAPIVFLGFHGGDQNVLSASANGEVLLWNRAALQRPQTRFKGVEGGIRGATVSPDGDYVLAVGNDDAHSIVVWRTPNVSVQDESIEPRLVIQNSVMTTAANFTADSKFVVTGGEDGVIRAWSIQENREVARFKGHDGPVAAIAALAEKGRFVSGGDDRSIRSWRFPTSLSAPGAEIPEGNLSDTTEVYDLEPPSLPEKSEEDPWDAARQALIAGTDSAADAIGVLDLIEGDDEAKAIAKQSLEVILEMESTENQSADRLSTQRRRLAASRRQIIPDEQAKVQANYSGGFSNLYFAADSNFKFGLETTFRPVELLFSDRFLYAARPSSVGPTRRKGGGYRNVKEVRDIASGKTNGAGYKIDDDGKPIYEEQKEDSIAEADEGHGDNGALLSWDYRYSQLQAHAWPIEDLEIDELYSLPQSAGVLSVPQMMLFNQDGTSKRFPDAEKWAATSWPNSDEQYLAVGLAGGNRVESDILRLFRIADLVKETPRPVSQYRSFEGVVTAMAFANTSAKIAFCVRERSVHRLFMADVQTMEVTLIEESKHTTAWLEDKKGTVARSSDASPGITDLAFSPDDGILIAHGRYDKDTYRFTGWRLDSDYKLALTKPLFMVEQDRKPYFQSIGSKSIYFINSSRYGNGGSASRINKILVRLPKAFAVVNLATGKIEREYPFLRTLHKNPIYSISQNGRWLVMGDDAGMVYMWDVMTGEKFSITMTQSVERMLRGSQKVPDDIRDRPAHAGPVVGVSFSEPDPGKEYPAFAASFGEENRIKVWELYPIVELQSQALKRRRIPTSLSSE